MCSLCKGLDGQTLVRSRALGVACLTIRHSFQAFPKFSISLSSPGHNICPLAKDFNLELSICSGCRSCSNVFSALGVITRLPHSTHPPSTVSSATLDISEGHPFSKYECTLLRIDLS